MSFGFWGWLGEKDTWSGDCFHINEWSVVCHIREFVMENLNPLRIRSTSRRAVFLASSRPQWARPCHTNPAISTASLRLHLTPPKTSWKGTFKLIHLRKQHQQRNWITWYQHAKSSNKRYLFICINIYRLK